MSRPSLTVGVGERRRRGGDGGEDDVWMSGSLVHSHWSSSNEARLSLVESFSVLVRQEYYAIKNQLGRPKTQLWFFKA